jgi:hypothetical protein
VSEWIRMGPAAERPIDVEAMLALVEPLVTGPSAGGPPAGYTYATQFLAHELVGRPRHSPPIVRRNVLDLESLYGAERTGLGAVLDGEGRFLLGNARGPDGALQPGGDLFRDAAGRALIPEPRNDHNLLLAQFHLLLQRFHNAVLDTLATPAGSVADRFALARHYVTRAFQRCVEDDLLPTLVQAHTLRHLRAARTLFFPHAGAGADWIPVEFTHGFARFGHSLVNSHYRVNGDLELHTNDVFTQIGGMALDGPDRLPARFRVDWKHPFAGTGNGRTSIARRLDPSVVSGTRHIPTPGPPLDLVRIDVEAAQRARLPDWRTFFGALGERYAGTPAFAVLPDVRGPWPRWLRSTRTRAHMYVYLRRLAPALQDALPLWLFGLLEALGDPAPGIAHGRQLGPFVGALYADVVLTSIRLQRHGAPVPAGAVPDDELVRLLRGCHGPAAGLRFADLVQWVERTEEQGGRDGIGNREGTRR